MAPWREPHPAMGQNRLSSGLDKGRPDVGQRGTQACVPCEPTRVAVVTRTQSTGLLAARPQVMAPRSGSGPRCPPHYTLSPQALPLSVVLHLLSPEVDREPTSTHLQALPLLATLSTCLFPQTPTPSAQPHRNPIPKCGGAPHPMETSVQPPRGRVLPELGGGSPISQRTFTATATPPPGGPQSWSYLARPSSPSAPRMVQ